MSTSTETKAIPKGYHAVTPMIVIRGAARLIEFLKDVFGAEESVRMNWPDGSVMHAELKIGDSLIMVSDVHGEWQPSTASLYIYVPDVDATYQRALRMGAVSLMEPANQFYGDRHGGVRDEFGNQWWMATNIEDVEPEELERRMKEWMDKEGACKPE